MTYDIPTVRAALGWTLASVALGGCFPTKGGDTACGEGTHVQDGLCVADGDTGDSAGTSDSDSGGDSGGDSSADSGADSSSDSGGDSSVDSGGDSSADSGADSGSDSGSTDSGSDSGSTDSGSDSGGADSGSDSGGADSGSDSGGDTGTTSAWTAYVCADGTGDYTSVQDAIDDAHNGDVIAVCAGIWGPAKIRDLDLTLVGVDGADATTLVGDDRQAALDANDATLDVSGFSLRGTKADEGSAIALTDTYATMHALRIADNYKNIAVDISGGSTDWDSITVEDNEATAYVFVAQNSGTLTLRHSVFSGNTATYYILYTYNMTAEISNDLFYENLSPGELFYLVGAATLYNSVFYDNSVTSGYNLGQVDPGATITNTIFQANASVRDLVSVSGTLNYTDFYSNTIPSGYTTTTSAGTGDLTSNPHFTNAIGHDFTLPDSSPCVNTGNPSSLYNDADGSRNDVGAFGGPYSDWSP